MTAPAPRRLLARVDFWFGVLASAVLVAAAALGWVPASPLEAAAVASGAACVWLVVRRSVWNFPLGILNCALSLILYASKGIYGDAGLQVLFILLGLHGWYVWLRGGPARAPRPVARVPAWEATAVAVLTPLAALGLQKLLEAVSGAAPLLDAQVTAMSVAAQWLLNRKYVENWYLWIALDVLTVYLMVTRELYLMAGLYVVFIGMCVAGVVTWSKELAEKPSAAA